MHITAYRFALTTHDIYGFSNVCAFAVKQQFKRIALDGILLADMVFAEVSVKRIRLQVFHLLYVVFLCDCLDEHP